MLRIISCRFVSAWVELYYHDDQEVQHDSELQSWIQEIHIEGFLGFTHTGETMNLTTIGHNYQKHH